MSISKVFTKVDRVDAAVCERAAWVSVADVHEAMGPNAHGSDDTADARAEPRTVDCRSGDHCGVRTGR
jgi:hypothetical protein